MSDPKVFLQSLHADTRAALVAAVAIGDRLDITREVSPLVVDTVTEAVIGSVERVLTMFERIASDRVVRPSRAVIEKQADATALRQLAFPKGAQCMRVLEMAGQRKAMAALITDKVAVAGVKRRGLAWAVAQVVARARRARTRRRHRGPLRRLRRRARRTRNAAKPAEEDK